MVRRELDVSLEDSVFWTDSTIVLQYVKNEERRFLTFVANRVAVIHSGSSPSQWHHIESTLNPADDVTGGQTAEEMLANKRWLNGPDFLCLEDSEWPKSPSLRDLSDEDPEIKPDKEVVTVCAVNKMEQVDVVDRLLKRHSSWHRLRKNYLRAKAKKQPTVDMQMLLTVDEMTRAEDAIILYIQGQSFCDELKFLQKDRVGSRRSQDYIKKTSPLYKLDPVLSADGIIRIGGRLKNAPVDEGVKRPAVLPKNHHVVTLIVRHFHRESGHS
ncbi:uncharacterized protein LOC119741257 [Patiria miniata]|uniref:Uncharacterized protein n=1 Tax=Patiria miniata TaxID=46514 RepID=A0A914BBX9_PATMI|nr:uncharacterized protein LOC119741257 [Patiria miniata]